MTFKPVNKLNYVGATLVCHVKT